MIDYRFMDRFFFRKDTYTTLNNVFSQIRDVLFHDVYTRDTHLLAQFSHVNKSDKRRQIRSRIRIVCSIPIWAALLASYGVSKAVIKKIWVSMNLIYREPYRITYAIFSTLKTKNLRNTSTVFFFFFSILSRVNRAIK